jgi:hypothetical protein
MSHLFNKYVTYDSAAIDAFSRLRVSDTETLFDSSLRYKDNSRWSSNTVNGTITHVSSESVMDLEIGTASGDRAYRQTKRVFSYQPGKSLLTLSSFVFSETKENLRQRVGYFSANNGVYLENDSGVNYIVLKSESLNTIERIPQTQWNGDKLDGTGESGFDLDVSKGNLFWIDVEWLGVGNVRTGFVDKGRFLIAHTFENINRRNTSYMTTATLPIRYEIENTGETSSNSILKQICSTVISEGGYQRKTENWSATRTTSIASVAVASGWAPVVSIRMGTNRTDSVIIPSQVHVVGDGNNAVYEYAIIRDATITEGTWLTHTPSTGNVEYNANATSMSGGTVVESGIITSSNQSKSTINQDLTYNWAMQLGKSIEGVSETMTLAVRHLAVGGNVYGSLNWYDLT